jgi:hypothetical protein
MGLFNENLAVGIGYGWALIVDEYSYKSLSGFLICNISEQKQFSLFAGLYFTIF